MQFRYFWKKNCFTTTNFHTVSSNKPKYNTYFVQLNWFSSNCRQKFGCRWSIDNSEKHFTSKENATQFHMVAPISTNAAAKCQDWNYSHWNQCLFVNWDTECLHSTAYSSNFGAKVSGRTFPKHPTVKISHHIAYTLKNPNEPVTYWESEVSPIVSLACLKTAFRSLFNIEPIGFKSAAEQSYFVTYPTKLKSNQEFVKQVDSRW